MSRAKEKTAAGTGKRNTITIALAPDVNEQVDRLLARNRGWGKATFIAQLVEFYARAPDSMKLLMVGEIPQDMREEFIAKAKEWIESLVKREAKGHLPAAVLPALAHGT